MKSLYICLLAAVAFLTGCDSVGSDERLIEVPAATVQRNVLIEDFTGQRCIFCPDAAEASTQQQKHPELEGKQLADVQGALKRVADKLLHEPTVRAKKLAASDSSFSSENALQELFGLQLEGSGVAVAVNELPTLNKEA